LSPKKDNPFTKILSEIADVSLTNYVKSLGNSGWTKISQKIDINANVLELIGYKKIEIWQL
jgi:hypothetical protein